MAITQVGTTVEQGITYGLSKWCDVLFSDGDWKASELARFSWCRWRDKYIGCCDATSTNIHTQQGPAVTQLLSYFNSSLSEASNNYVAYYNDNRIPTNEPYCFNILMYGRNGDQTLTSDNAANYRVVTSCSDFQSLYVLVNKYQPAQSTISVNYPTARTVNCNNLLWANGGVYNTNNNAHAQWITVWTVFVIDEDNFFVTRGMAFPNYTPCMYDGVIGSAQNNLRPSNNLSISYGNRITESKWNYSYGDITNYQKTTHLLRWYKNGITGIEPQSWGDSKYGVYDVDDDVAIIMRSGNAVYGNIGIRYTYYLKSEEAVKNAIAYTGLRWRYQNGDTEHIYTPIIDGDGYITGYSTDPEAVTKLNDITDVTGNNISPLPPAPVPPTPGDDAEPETFGWGGNEVGGMVHYYLLTQSEMESLAGFMSNPNWTIDYRNCIVSMFIIPNNGTVVFDDETFEHTTVKFRLDENNKVDTGISCNRIHNVVNNHGTIEIPRMNNNFLDYEPYSKYYVYVPFCGVTSLPDYIAGKEITVSIYPDVPTCSCTAVISSEGRKIATLRGNFGSSIPVTSDGSGLKTAAVINSMANGLVGLGEMAAGAGLDNPGLVIGGGMTAISSILQTALTFGQAFGYSVGSSGDTSFFGIGNRCEYYIAYPQWNNPDVDEGELQTNIYGHTYGFVCNKRGLLKEFEGFTVCDNPHVYGFSCTSDEKDEIERLLREGIIIHMHEE